MIFFIKVVTLTSIKNENFLRIYIDFESSKKKPFIIKINFFSYINRSLLFKCTSQMKKLVCYVLKCGSIYI